MKNSHRLRLLEILSRRTRMDVDTELHRLQEATSRRDEQSERCSIAEHRAATAFEQLQQQTSPGQSMNLDMVRSSASYMLACEGTASQARKDLGVAQKKVNQARDRIAKNRLRLEKLDDFKRDEVKHIAHQQLQVEQHDVDELWLMSNPTEGAGR